MSENRSEPGRFKPVRFPSETSKFKPVQFPSETSKFKPVQFPADASKFKPVEAPGSSDAQNENDDEQDRPLTFNDRPVYMLVFGLAFGILAAIITGTLTNGFGSFSSSSNFLNSFIRSLPVMIGFFIVSVGISIPDGIMNGSRYQIVQTTLLIALFSATLFPLAGLIVCPTILYCFHILETVCKELGGFVLVFFNTFNKVDAGTFWYLCFMGSLAVCAGAIPGMVGVHFLRIILGVIGSLIGTIVGVFVISGIGFVFNFEPDHVGLKMGLIILVIGFITELFIAMTEEALKQGWLFVKSGRMAGKQFILYRNPTMIGSSVKSHIFLAKDPNVAGFHTAIYHNKNEFVLKPQAPTLLNGRIARDCVLRNNSVIQIGSTSFVFKTKKIRENVQ